MKGMSKVVSTANMGSMGQSSIMHDAKVRQDIKDPLLIDIDTYMTELVTKITSAGVEKLKKITQIYHDNKEKIAEHDDHEEDDVEA